MSILHDLGIEPRELLVNGVGFLILLWLMKRYLFGPVGSFIRARQERIAHDLDAAQADREKAGQERAAIESRRAEIMQGVRQQAEQAREQARRKAAGITKTAKDDARKVEQSARAATERDVRRAQVQLRREVGAAAATMCRRILQQGLTEQRHQALLDEFIADIERLAAQEQGQS